MKRRMALLCLVIGGLVATTLGAVPAGADPPETILIGTVDTGVSEDCAVTGSGFSGQPAPHHSNVNLLTYDPADEFAEAEACAEAVYDFMLRQVDGEFGVNATLAQQLRTILLTGPVNFSKPYEVFLQNIYLSAPTLASLSEDALGSCEFLGDFLIVHCLDDTNGQIHARDTNGNAMYWLGQPVYINLSGIMSGSGGTMYGNIFLENESNPEPVDVDRRVQHHEQVHGQQWAQYGWDFGRRYISEDLGNTGDWNYYYWTWGRVEGLRVPAKCFNVFERNAGFANGRYALRWDEHDGDDDGIVFPEDDGAYPDTWLNDSDNDDDDMCPTTW